MRSCVPVLVFALAAVLSVAPACADDSGNELKKDMKELGRTVGEAGKDVGLEIADAAKKVWYKGVEVSEPLLEDVQRETRKFWRKVVKQKDETLADLRRENEELRRRMAERRRGSTP